MNLIDATKEARKHLPPDLADKLVNAVQSAHLELIQLRKQVRKLTPVEEPAPPCAICRDEPRASGLIVCTSCRDAAPGTILRESLASEVVMLRRQVAELEAVVTQLEVELETKAKTAALSVAPAGKEAA